MRFSLLLALIVVASAPEARAQPPYGTPGTLAERFQRGLEDNALQLGGGVVALASGFVTVEAMELAGLSDEAQIAGAYFVGAAGFALGVHGAAQLVGVDGTLRNAMGDAMTGAAIGAPAGVATMFLLGAVIPESECSGFICLDSRTLIAAFAGAGVAVGVPVLWVLLDYRNESPPVRLGASGTSGPGVALSVGL